MASNAKGFAVYRSGWSGAVTLTAGSTVASVSPAAHTSPLLFASRIVTLGQANVGSDFAFTVTGAGLLQFTCTTSFSIAFAGDTGTRLGFSGTSATATTHTAGSIARGSVYPYAQDAVLYTFDIPLPARPALQLAGGAINHRVPGLDWKAPDLQIKATRVAALQTIEAFAFMDTPSKISVLTGTDTLAHLHVSRVKTKTQDHKSGWAEISVGVAL